ncbi:MAG: LPS translocon maturation chaperone LptM [Burkholderiaceae bacterium]
MKPAIIATAITRTRLGVLLLLLASGCGQKGPLRPPPSAAALAPSVSAGAISAAISPSIPPSIAAPAFGQASAHAPGTESPLHSSR